MCTIFRNTTRPHIPYACGTHSVALRNPFRTHTEYMVDTRNKLPHMKSLLHEGDLRRCFQNSASVTYVSTLPSTSSSAPCILSFVQSLGTFEANVREWHFVQHSHEGSKKTTLVIARVQLQGSFTIYMCCGAISPLRGSHQRSYRRTRGRSSSGSGRGRR